MDFDEVFSFKNYYKASRKCRLGVSWKASVQRYLMHELRNVSVTLRKHRSRTYKERPFTEFTKCENKKVRKITKCYIDDRPTQKCLTEECLLKALRPSLIYDNGACLKCKGIDFAKQRLHCHLERYYRQHHTNQGYALLFDFKSYFASIPHKLLVEKVSKYIKDKHLISLYEQLVNDHKGEVGLGLGSQISQISAIFYPNKIDHRIKEQMHIKHYVRYMDDGVLIHESKEHLQKCLAELRELCAELKITLNEKKTQIADIRHGFNFLQRFWFVTDTGKVIEKASKASIVRERRKLKKLDKHKVSLASFDQSFNSWRGSLVRCNSHNQLRRMQVLYEEIRKRIVMEEFLSLLNKYTNDFEKGEFGFDEYVDYLTAILPDKELAVKVGKLLKEKRKLLD